MATINQLSAVSSSEITANSLLALYDNSNGDARKMSLTAFLSWLNGNFARQDYITTIATPGDGFTETVTQDGLNRWILLRPTGALATGTVVLPAPSVASDGQEVLITTTLQITSFTVNGNGATAVYGAPSTFAAEDAVTFRFNALTDSWYKVA